MDKKFKSRIIDLKPSIEKQSQLQSQREFITMNLDAFPVEEQQQVDIHSLQHDDGFRYNKDDFTTPRRRAKWPRNPGTYIHSGDGGEGRALPHAFISPLSSLKQSRSFHRERRKAATYTKRKKERHHPYSYDDESTCDADLDDSDSTLEANKTTITTTTSKTSSMSLGLTANSFLRDKFMQEELLTPPRGFVRSFPQVECSPLSLSFQSSSPSSSSSSICGDCNEDPVEAQVSREDNEERCTSFKTIPKTLYVKTFCERRVFAPAKGFCGERPMSQLLTELPQDILKRLSCVVTQVFNKVISVKISIKKSKKATIRLSKVIRSLMAVTIIYSASIIVLTTPKLHQNSSDTSVKRLKRLREFTSIKPLEKDSFMVTTVNNRYLNRRVTIFNPNHRLAIKRTLGGLHPIYSFGQDIVPFDKLEKGKSRSHGLGELKIEMYQKKGSYSDKTNIHPRIFHFDEAKKSAHHHIVRELKLYPTVFSDNTQLYGIRDSGDPALANMEPIVDDESSECVPMADWQSTHHPSCNGMHELDLVNLEDVALVGKKGYWRNAWRIDLEGKSRSKENETLILKTPKFDHNFEVSYYEHDRVDAQAMERLTFSPHVINIYGFCGRSVISEFADGPRLGTLADKAKKHPLKRLKIARDIAQGLSHVHFGRGDENASFVHLDVNPANIVVVNNTLKMNDFNIGIMLKRNITSDSQCSFPAQFPNPQWRSPEEANELSNLNEKVDVFSMGHIFFRLVCGHEPWNKLEVGGKPSSAILKEKVMSGILPRIPDIILNTSNPEEKIIRDAMLACYTIDPDERPSSRDVAEFLEYELSKLSRGGKYQLDKEKK